jgi:hypothetical protein
MAAKSVDLCAPAAAAPCRPTRALYDGLAILKSPVLLDFRGCRPSSRSGDGLSLVWPF